MLTLPLMSCRIWPRAPMANNSSAAIPGLRTYLGAQGTFQRVDRYGKGELVYANPKDGVGFPDLYRIGGPLAAPDGTEIKLIDLALARATSPETNKAGYWFVEITSDAVTGRPYDYTKDCGLCAVPAAYGKTGLYTYIIDLTGTVYKKDNGGKPVTVYPDVEKDGWRPVGM
jgi:hypothetical protein